ncbi:MAG: DUF4126 domain-containing protein [Spirulinaceae cyanobacterium RM2_2_10]|nr:DUF4126 domain-containing protein [Spirulinaceae cyanobacterium SM2_1_0]NJO21159.1 DUF4126 domain-containing protein [Spirulinaceae cyanobacterium RM2_2_10]
MELLLSLCLGIGLSAACGFRIFVPFLIVSLAAHSGHLTLSGDLLWLGSAAAIALFSIATGIEVIAYYIPWLDNALDLLAEPAAIIAGMLMTATFMHSAVGGVSPLLLWTTAAIAGGGTAGLVEGFTILARLGSTATTGGLANPLFATVEVGSAATLSLLALSAPAIAALTVLFLLGLSLHRLAKLWRRWRDRPR